MASRKLKVLINVGTDDQKKYALPNSPSGDYPLQEGDVISVDEDVANVLVNTLKVARDYDAKEEKAAAAEAREAAAEAALPDVQSELAREQAVKDATKIAKGK